MITATSSNKPIFLATAAPPRAAAPPAPSAPKDRVEFSSIDTPAKAAVMPSLNPVLQFAVLSAMSACAMSSCGMHATLAMNLTNVASKETTRLDMKYQMAAPNSLVMRMKGSGKLGEAEFNEEWSLDLSQGDDEALRVKGKTGTTVEDVTMASKNGTNSLTGKIGDVAVQLTVGQGSAPNSSTLDGKLQDTVLHKDVQLESAHDPGAMWNANVSGTLGDASIQYSGKAAVLADQKGLGLTEKGTIAGYDFDLTAEFRPDLKP